MKKVIYRIPTEQYGYVEIEDDIDEGFFHPEKLLEQYQSFKDTFSAKIGLPTKDFNACLDRYLTDGTGETNVYLAMSPAQQAVIQEVKKAFKRLDAKELKTINKPQ